MVIACNPCLSLKVMRFDSWARPLYILVIFNFFFQYILRFAYLAPIFELWTFWSWVNHLTISATKAKWFCKLKRARSWCKLYAILKCHSSPSKDTYSVMYFLRSRYVVETQTKINVLRNYLYISSLVLSIKIYISLTGPSLGFSQDVCLEWENAMEVANFLYFFIN